MTRDDPPALALKSLAHRARHIARLAEDAHALARRDFPSEAKLAEDLARAACGAIALARAREAIAHPLRVVRCRV